MGREQQESFGRQKWFYTLVGAGGISLLALSCILRFDSLTWPAVLLHLIGAGVVVAWMVEGFVSVSRREREAQEAREAEAVRAKAQAEAQQAAVEAQRATERAIREVMSRRTVSHGGMTINVRRTPSHDVDSAIQTEK